MIEGKTKNMTVGSKMLNFNLKNEATRESRHASSSNVNWSHKTTYSIKHVCRIHRIFHANPGKGKANFQTFACNRPLVETEACRKPTLFREQGVEGMVWRVDEGC